ncbi:hypothetical protein N7495_004252 [Penicillium taxi]|uniref:uncharacterized protein n=1 Tax=Penicillium taxi TaxID=168475 RepID=UPI002544D4F3|nr:uncharacterized protein N7495_004252 [Penicillium taxi]KAJ5899508.1 hypothetical protein N7495_004252 [Penicillium taxi]
MTLFSAAEKGDLRKVQYLISQGTYVGASDYGCNATPLHVACAQGHVEVVRTLLMNGADFECDSDNYEFPMHAACEGGSPEIIRLLLDAGADVDIKTLDGRTPLEEAIFAGHLEATQTLIDANADIHVKGGFFGTALIAAVHSQNIPVARQLLRMGADPNAEAGEYGNALMAAMQPVNKKSGEIQCERLEMVSLLLKYGAEPDMITTVVGDVLSERVMEPPLYSAIMSSTSRTEGIEMVKLLFEYGADANIQCGEYGTALGAALSLGNSSLTELLLDNGANVNVGGGEHDTPLIAAVGSSNLPMVKLFVDRGARVNTIGGEYGTALHTAASMGNATLVKYLVESGADVNIIAGKYGSVLSAAAYSADRKLDILLAAREDEARNIRRDANPRAYYEVELQSSPKPIEPLEPEIIEVQFKELFPSIKEIFEFLLLRGVDPNAQGSKYGSPLHIVSAYHFQEHALDLSKFLIEYGADINFVGGKFDTALHAAAYKGHVNLFQYLLDLGAEICIHDREGRTAPDLATQNVSEILRCVLVKKWITWES